MHGLRSPLVGTISDWTCTWRTVAVTAGGVSPHSMPSSGTVTRKPHQPHYQSRDYNPLNGDIERWFEPVSGAVCANGFMRGILGVCTAIFNAASPNDCKMPNWHVEMHQFRIEADGAQSGLPTPEGAHRDGVDWVCVLLVNRRNVSSGVTQIFDPEGRSLGEFTLTDPLDTVFLDDRRVLHGVTPITPMDLASKASRDVLVLTFRATMSRHRTRALGVRHD